MHYIIHAIPERLWYVNGYLIPDMKKQGISNIHVYVDDEHEGNLQSFLHSIELYPYNAWHLQDDVCISSIFHAITKDVQNKNVLCGFCSQYSKDKASGAVHPQDMWYSFPCIYISRKYAKEFMQWIKTDAMKNQQYATWIRAGKYDDSLFMEFMQERHSNDFVYNIKPNIVNHIDYLIGGSVVNKIRSKDATSLYWEEPDIIKELEVRLHGVNR